MEGFCESESSGARSTVRDATLSDRAVWTLRASAGHDVHDEVVLRGVAPRVL
jgi:hypothetical protein